MNTKTSAPLHFGFVMIAVAVFLTFPAFGDMLESQSLDLWNQKMSSMGIIYTIGSLFWSYLAFIFSFFLIAFGIKIIRNRDNAVPD